MGTEPRTQITFTQGRQNKEELDASPSSLFYLFQEVSKLDFPSSFVEADQHSKWLDGVSRKDPLIHDKESGDAHSLQTSDSSSQQNLSHVIPFCQVEMLSRESQNSDSPTSDRPESESNSPWKVLSLINFHCEKLLYQKDVEDFHSHSSPMTFIPSADRLSIPARATTEGRAERETEHDVEPLLSVRQQITAGCVDEVNGDCAQDENKLLYCIKNSEVECSGQIQVAEKTDAVVAKPLKNDVTSPLQPKQRLGQEAEQSHKLLPHILHSFPNTNLTFNSNDKAQVAPYKLKLTLDHNANILSTELPFLRSVIPASQSATSAEERRSLSQQNAKIPTSELGGSNGPTEDDSPSDSKQKSPVSVSSATSQAEILTQQREELCPSSPCQWRAKTQRKQPHPSRSADSHDPDFHGVSFTMETEMDGSKEQCRLLITSKYSKELCKGVRKSRLRRRTSRRSLKTSSSEEEIDQIINTSQGKVCASCCTRKTPMWRDAEDGTPLCNACGIRYKKYRVRCVNCWHIPRKESSSNSCCPKCGNSVRLTSAQRKHTT